MYIHKGFVYWRKMCDFVHRYGLHRLYVRNLNRDRNYTLPTLPADFVSIPAHPRPVSLPSSPMPAELPFHRHPSQQKFQSTATRFRKIAYLLTQISNINRS